MDALADNPFIQTLALQSPWLYVYETTILFYVYHLATQVIKSHQGYAYEFLLLNLRAFGSLYLLVPLLLGNLPGEYLTNFDTYAKYTVASTVAAYLFAKHLPRDLQFYLAYPGWVAYAVFLGNAVATAVDSGTTAFPDSYGAAAVIGFLGVQGHTLLENGINGALGVSEFDADQVLGIFGPILYLLVTRWYPIGIPVVLVRVLLIVLRLVADRYDFNEAIEYVQSILHTVVLKIPKSRR